jgi:hypothetical protein
VAYQVDSESASEVANENAIENATENANCACARVGALGVLGVLDPVVRG